MSLSALNQPPHNQASNQAPRHDSKVPTPGNVNALRAALEAAMKGKNNVGVTRTTNPEAPFAGVDPTIAGTKPDTAHKDSKSTPREVPEDILKKVLKME